MQLAIASGHHGVLFSLKKATRKKMCVVWSTVGEGEGAHRQTYDKTSNGPHMVFYVPGLRYGKIVKPNVYFAS
jgi:hypothetical protein